VDIWGASQEGTNALTPLVNSTATSWLNTNQDVLKSTEPGPSGLPGISAPSIVNIDWVDSDMVITLSDGSHYGLPVAPVMAMAVSDYLTAHPVTGTTIQSVSVDTSGMLLLSLSDASNVTVDLSTYANAAIHSIVDPKFNQGPFVNGTSLSGNALTFTYTSGPSTVLTLPSVPTLSNLTVTGTTLQATLSDSSSKTVSLSSAITNVLNTAPYFSTASLSSNAIVFGRNGTTPVSLTLPPPIYSASLSNGMLILTTASGAVSVDLSSLAMPTLTQYSSDAAAAAALSPGALYIDSNNFVKAVAQPALTPLSLSNLYVSQNPALTNTWSTINNTLSFNSGEDYGTFGLSSSLLTALNFSWTAPWMFVLKAKSLGTNLRAIMTIDPIGNWATHDGLYTECIATPQTPYVYLRSSGQPNTMEAFGAPYVVVNNTPVDANISSANGCFIVYSWDGTNAKIEFLTSTGSLIYSSQIARAMSNRVTPIAFYSDQDTFQFLKGLYFSQSYQPFSVWGGYF
jgi:hypothetical protein